MPQRIQQIKNWLKVKLKAEIQSFQPASNDASFRRYFRVFFQQAVFKQALGQSFIIMDAPPEKESMTDFIEIAAQLENTGVNVPHLYAINQHDGFILMSDLGHRDYLTVLNSDCSVEKVNKLYADAMSALVIMQLGMQSPSMALPQYNPDRLRTEMQLLPDWYIHQHYQYVLNQAEQTILEQAMNCLIISAEQQPQVFVHRDYHSRNLLVYTEHNPAIIDFQDAVIGPITYDLVSLLRDSYIAWSDETVSLWVEQYRQMLLREKLIIEDDSAQFTQWFDWMGIQRQLKVVGIFCRLNYRDGKTHYLQDIPQTLEYLFRVGARYPEFHPLLELLDKIAGETRLSGELL
jgi:aminoglycoside/choline kinase family phosphotransferase